MAEPAEGALDHPAPLQHHEASLIRVLFDDAAAQAVNVAPILTALGGEGAIQHCQAQARPSFMPTTLQEAGSGTGLQHAGRATRPGCLDRTEPERHRDEPPKHRQYASCVQCGQRALP